MMSLYSCIVQSSAINRTMGRTNGTILLLRNSSFRAGMTLCRITRCEREGEEEEMEEENKTDT